MTRQELLDLHGTTCNKAFSIVEAKNADYTGGSDDPFANFRATEMLGVPAEIGILTRCLDKFQRIRSFTVNGTLAVKGESVDDAIEDVINYMVLLKGVIKDRVSTQNAATISATEDWLRRGMIPSGEGEMVCQVGIETPEDRAALKESSYTEALREGFEPIRHPGMVKECACKIAESQAPEAVEWHIPMHGNDRCMCGKCLTAAAGRTTNALKPCDDPEEVMG